MGAGRAQRVQGQRARTLRGGRQWLAGQADAGDQRLGHGRPASGCGGGDAQPVGEHLVRGPAQFTDLPAADLHGDVTTEHGLPPGQGLAATGQPDQVAGVESGQIHVRQHVQCRADIG